MRSMPIALWIAWSLLGPPAAAETVPGGEPVRPAAVEAERVVVRGTVYRGDEGHPATLTFTTVARTAVETVTDERGAYEAVAPEPLRSVEVRLDGVEGPPYLEFFPTAVDGAGELDFRVALGVHRARVVDAATGRPVPGAAVGIRNLYTSDRGDHPPGAKDGEPGREQRMAVAQTAVTDETGTARLPPLRPGVVELWASAEGYRAMREPLSVALDDADSGRDFDLALEPMR